MKFETVLSIRSAALAALVLTLAACGGGYSSGGGGGGGGGPNIYAISGTVTSNGAGVAGITVTLSGAASAVTTTAVDGSYSFGGLAMASYQVTPSSAGFGFAPVARVVTLGSSNSTGNNFARSTLANPLSISGTVTGNGSANVRITLTGDNTGAVLTGAGGAYTIPGLAVGNYTLTPSRSGYTYAPTTRSVVGETAFEHTQTGNGTLGNVSLTSVSYGLDDVLPFFEITSPPVDGAGTVRARRTAEIAAPDLAAFENMWNTGGTVVVTIATDLGPFTLDLVLGTFPQFTAAGASFTVTESLILATGNDFASTP